MTAPDETGEMERIGEAHEVSRSAKADERSQAGDTSAALEVHPPGAVTGQTPGDLDAEGQDGQKLMLPPLRRRRRRPLRMTVIALVVIAVVAAAGAATTGVFGGDDSGSASAAPSAPPNTAKVQRTTLTRTETVDGNLGYGDASEVQASGAPGASGIVTWVPEDGEVIKRGGTVYKVNEQKIPLLYGSIPFYRTLSKDSEGKDVEILEKNLSALGYGGFTVDDEYTSRTADAVKEWQDDLERKETGKVQPGDALIADGPRRVAEVRTVPGTMLTGTVLTWTGTTRIVSVHLDVQFEDMVEKGTKAKVTLPDDTTVEADVTDVGTASTPEDGGSGNPGTSGSSDEATLPVELRIKNQKALRRYQAAAVDVTLNAETRKSVLAVPVDALVAQRGGGYAVEVVGPNGVEPRKVKVGMFADSMVEVSGAGITEGLVVGVPK